MPGAELRGKSEASEERTVHSAVLPTMWKGSRGWAERGGRGRVWGRWCGRRPGRREGQLGGQLEGHLGPLRAGEDQQAA